MMKPYNVMMRSHIMRKRSSGYIMHLFLSCLTKRLDFIFGGGLFTGLGASGDPVPPPLVVSMLPFVVVGGNAVGVETEEVCFYSSSDEFFFLNVLSWEAGPSAGPTWLILDPLT